MLGVRALNQDARIRSAAARELSLRMPLKLLVQSKASLVTVAKALRISDSTDK